MSEWTVESLKEHFDCMLIEREQKVNERFNAMQLAITKAEESTKIHFENVNNWRLQLDKQENTFALKGETDKEFTSVQLQLAEIKDKLQNYESMKKGEGNVFIYIVLAINLLGTILSIYMSLKK